MLETLILAASKSTWHDPQTAPKDGTEFLALIKGCDTGKLKRVPLSHSEDGWMFDGSELSNAWDVIAWTELSPIPAILDALSKKD